jgi:hypothetical protein
MRALGEVYPYNVPMQAGPQKDNPEFCKKLAALSKRMSKHMRNVFPQQAAVMKQTEDIHNVIPCEEMGGKEGICHAMAVSEGLANASHYDPNDGSIGMAVWHELEVGDARNWMMYFPNMVVVRDGKVYKGLAIRLHHGTMIAWDGRILRHATTVTHTSTSNRVFGTFFAASGNAIKYSLNQQSGTPSCNQKS